MSKVIPAIKSRCTSIRIPLPTTSDKFVYLKYKGNDQNDFLLYEQCKKYSLFVLLIGDSITYRDKLKDYSKKISDIIQTDFDISTISNIRTLSCEIKGMNLPIEQLLRYLTDDLSNSMLLDDRIMKVLSDYEHATYFSYRELIYIESLIINLHKTINNI